MSMTIVLWDIDGTLVRGKGNGVSVNAFVRALQRASGLDGMLVYPKDASGKTDSQIALEALVAAEVGNDAAEAVLKAFGPAYLGELEQQREQLMEDLQVLPGVPEVLAQLRDLGATQTLLTGNLEPIARLKLALVQLDQYVDFDLGAYGSDHADRTCLVPIVRQRLQARRGFEPDVRAMVVVGDTPRDIECARAGGIRVVAVTTGIHSREALEAHQPDAILENLADTEKVVATLLRYSRSSEDRALIV